MVVRFPSASMPQSGDGFVIKTGTGCRSPSLSHIILMPCFATGEIVYWTIFVVMSGNNIDIGGKLCITKTTRYHTDWIFGEGKNRNRWSSQQFQKASYLLVNPFILIDGTYFQINWSIDLGEINFLTSSKWTLIP